MLRQLYSKVEDTKRLIEDDKKHHQFTMKETQQYAKSSNHLTMILAKGKWRWETRQIYHPSETKINIFFIVTSMLKIIFCSILAAFSARGKSAQRNELETGFIICCIVVTLETTTMIRRARVHTSTWVSPLNQKSSA